MRCASGKPGLDTSRMSAGNSLRRRRSGSASLPSNCARMEIWLGQIKLLSGSSWRWIWLRYCIHMGHARHVSQITPHEGRANARHAQNFTELGGTAPATNHDCRSASFFVQRIVSAIGIDWEYQTNGILFGRFAACPQLFVILGTAE
jgi:hypothetical protein